MQILDPVQCVAVMKELGAYSNTWPITMALAEQHSNDAKVRLSSATLSYSSWQSRASMLTAMGGHSCMGMPAQATVEAGTCCIGVRGSMTVA